MRQREFITLHRKWGNSAVMAPTIRCSMRVAENLLGNLMVPPKLAVAAVILVHSWYPQECCNGDEHSGDCHPISCEEIITVDSYCRTFACKWGGLEL